jgi:PPK2 family polyphosphate:nucleotide phosphotransferase
VDEGLRHGFHCRCFESGCKQDSSIRAKLGSAGGAALNDQRELIRHLRTTPGDKVSLKRHRPDWTGKIRQADAAELLADGTRKLASEQDKLYAQDTYAVLVIFQAMDAAGKDGTIKHVMAGVNPQGCQVFSFKAPSPEERDHGYLWRSVKALPERGRIGIHNRSYYEEVLVARVHPEILASQQLPPERKTKGIWKERFAQINDFERYLYENGTIPVKIFLHVSKAEQKRRFLSRIDEPAKNWKFSVNDLREREHWRDYMRAYEDVLTETSTPHAPWYIVPADHKWFTRLAVSGIVYQTLRRLKLRYPPISDQQRRALARAKRLLLAE